MLIKTTVSEWYFLYCSYIDISYIAHTMIFPILPIHWYFLYCLYKVTLFYIRRSSSSSYTKSMRVNGRQDRTQLGGGGINFTFNFCFFFSPMRRSWMNILDIFFHPYDLGNLWELWGWSDFWPGSPISALIKGQNATHLFDVQTIKHKFVIKVKKLKIIVYLEKNFQSFGSFCSRLVSLL